jgi:phosphoglycerate dehydrogenase-like enzyme
MVEVCVTWDVGKPFLDGYSRFFKEEIPVIIKKNEIHRKIEKILSSEIIVRGVFVSEFLKSNKLRLVHSMIKSTRNLPIDKLKERKIRVTRTTGAWGISAAEYVLMAILMLSRDIKQFLNKRVEKEQWSLNPESDVVKNKIIAILGNGEIGISVARYCKVLGMKTIVVGKKRKNGKLRFVDKFYEPSKILEAIEKADYIVVALPYAKDTIDSVNKTIFDSLRKKPFLINISRGGIVNERDMKFALREGKIRGVFLDVFQNEPPKYDDNLFRLKNVYFTPHIAGVTMYTEFLMGIVTGKVIKDFLDGKLSTQSIQKDGLGYEVVI